MLNFKHTSLEHSTAEWNGKIIELWQNTQKYWVIFVDGRRVKEGPFVARSFAIRRIEEVIRKIDPSLSPAVLVLKFCYGCRKEVQVEPEAKVCKFCGTEMGKERKEKKVKPLPDASTLPTNGAKRYPFRRQPDNKPTERS
jgi:hypothetical protein